MVQFTQQQHLDLGTRLFFFAIEAGGKHLGIVQHEDVAVLYIIHQVLEHAVLNGLGSAVQHHQAGFVTVFGRIRCNQLLWQIELEL